MSIDPSQAPSMRANAVRLLPSSTTAMFMGTPIWSALVRAPSTTFWAASSVTVLATTPPLLSDPSPGTDVTVSRTPGRDKLHRGGIGPPRLSSEERRGRPVAALLLRRMNCETAGRYFFCLHFCVALAESVWPL